MSTLAVSPDGGTTHLTYEVISSSKVSANKSETLYREQTSSLAEPRTLQVSHDIATAQDGIDRHLVKLARTDEDADGNPFTGSVHCVIAAPRDGVTKANLLLEFKKLYDVISENWDSVYGGFMPTD